jgi:endonuclease YncB( thermonuclease family)
LPVDSEPDRNLLAHGNSRVERQALFLFDQIGLAGNVRLQARATVLLAAFLLAIGQHSAQAQTFTAKVVGISDGDTITVYDGIQQTKIRLEGIDCPEDGADFSHRAKQFTSELVFGKEVRIVGKEFDKRKRLLYLSHRRRPLRDRLARQHRSTIHLS